MIRMEIALILVLLFIACVYFSAERPHTLLHKTFSVLLITVIVHLIFDAATIYTVNHLDSVPAILNRILHRMFIGIHGTGGISVLSVYCNSCTGRDRKNQTVRYGGKNVSGSGGNRSQFFSVSDKHPHGTGKKVIVIHAAIYCRGIGKIRLWKLPGIYKSL